MNPRRLAFILFLLVFAGSSVAAGIFFLDARDEYRRLQSIEADNRRKLAEAEKRLGEQETVLNRLKTDPAYVEKVIRIKLEYAKPDEWVFRFEEP